MELNQLVLLKDFISDESNISQSYLSLQSFKGHTKVLHEGQFEWVTQSTGLSSKVHNNQHVLKLYWKKKKFKHAVAIYKHAVQVVYA